MDLNQKALQIRKNCLEAAFKSGKSAHIGGSLSCAEILAALYGSYLKSPGLLDHFIMSKGHCSLALYAALEAFGHITHDDLLSFNANGSAFTSHMVKNLKYGLELSSGSLGLGLSFAAGKAYSLKLEKKPGQICVLVGDGELGEGSLWEGAMFAGYHRLDNLTLIVDANCYQIDGKCTDIAAIDNYAQKLEAFGFECSVCNGHHATSLADALSKGSDKPKAVIAQTVKGKGVCFMENNVQWHHGLLNEELFNRAMAELEGGAQ